MTTSQAWVPIFVFLVGWSAQSSFRVITSYYLSSRNADDDTLVFLSSRHAHRIPNILIFTHYKNLLLPPPPPSLSPLLTRVAEANSSSNSSNGKASKLYDSPPKEDELQALRNNIRHTISLHPDAKIRFLTNDDCLTSIKNVLPYLTLPMAAKVSLSTLLDDRDDDSVETIRTRTRGSTIRVDGYDRELLSR
jgi:hypothetical protein